MSILKRIMLWALTLFFSTGAIAALPAAASVFSFLLTVLFLPIEKWQNFLGKHLKGVIKALLIIVLLILFVAYFPQTEEADPVLPSPEVSASPTPAQSSKQPESSAAVTPSPSPKPAASPEPSVELSATPSTAAKPSTSPTPAPTSSPKPSASPTPTSTPAPSTVQGITIISSPGTVTPNSYVSMSIQGKPNTDYTISVYYSSGASKAEGLGAKTSDGNGYVTWTWKVGGKTKPGTYRIVVSGGGTSITEYFTVT